MLVLQRKPGEEIVIGDSVVVKLVKAGPNRVTIAIEAPQDVPIRRAELVTSEPAATHERREKPSRSVHDTICL